MWCPIQNNSERQTVKLHAQQWRNITFEFALFYDWAHAKHNSSIRQAFVRNSLQFWKDSCFGIFRFRLLGLWWYRSRQTTTKAIVVAEQTTTTMAIILILYGVSFLSLLSSNCDVVPEKRYNNLRVSVETNHRTTFKFIDLEKQINLVQVTGKTHAILYSAKLGYTSILFMICLIIKLNKICETCFRVCCCQTRNY